MNMKIPKTKLLQVAHKIVYRVREQKRDKALFIIK